MQDLIQKIAQSAGLDEAAAQSVIGTILSMLQQHAPEGLMQQLLEALPGADTLIDQASQASSGMGGGLLGGLMGALGGVLGNSGAGSMMQLFSQLSEQGLSPEQMQSVGQEIFSYASSHLGQDKMDALVGSVPGLRDLV